MEDSVGDKDFHVNDVNDVMAINNEANEEVHDGVDNGDGRRNM